MKETLKVKIGQYCKNQIPSDNEEAAGDWTDLTPSLPFSPEVADFMDKLNQENDVAVHTPPSTPSPEPSIGVTLALLDVPAPQKPPIASPRPLPILHTPPFKDESCVFHPFLKLLLFYRPPLCIVLLPFCNVFCLVEM